MNAAAVPGPVGMDLFTAMRKRRMHRAFAPDPVPRDVLEQLVWAAARAATARAGIRHLVVVDDLAIVRTFRQACPGFVNDAPAAIVICTDLEAAATVGGRSGTDEVGRIDAGTAAAHLTLAAPALGLGACIVTSWTASAVRAVIEAPPNIRPEILVAIGYPAATPSMAFKAPPRIVHENRYGTPWEA